jgi:carbamoyl-phosphate synthase large subunit
LNPRNVLVFPGGTEIGLEVCRALSECKEVRLMSAGSPGSGHASYAYAEHFEIPAITEPGWLEALNEVIARHSVDYVIPTHEDVILALARARSEIAAHVVSSPLETCEICRSKTATYRHLRDVVRTPEVIDPADPGLHFPVFVKPDRGAGSAGARLARDRRHLAELFIERDDLIVLEHLPGEEFTIDCFSDRERGLLFSGGRKRVRTRSGISMDSYPVRDPDFEVMARAIAERLEFHGAWFFQAKFDGENRLVLLEVAPRVAGTSALHRCLGVNFPLLSIYEHDRLPITIMTNDIDVRIDRALVNRYQHDLEYDTVYVDLDDTLLVREHVNLNLVRFLYQCVNEGKRIVVLTRHAADPVQTLGRFRLGSLPDDVVHLTPGEHKSDHILAGPAIFIDDSFGERREVAEKRGIPTFDSSMIEMLFDERAR